MRIEDENERHFYEIEAVRQSWSLAELNRQYDSSLYERLSLSADKDEVMRLSREGQVVEKPSDLVKDPYILEFTVLPSKAQLRKLMDESAEEFAAKEETDEQD